MDKLSFHAINYSEASQELLNDLYGLRKEIFSDRLEWRVTTHHGREIDEYDNAEATYLVGLYAGRPLSSLRLINTLNPYMVEGPFRKFFKCGLPKHESIAESSRFFVDKTRSRAMGLSEVPLTEMLLLAMHDHAARHNLDSIITVVSQAMSRIVLRAGWRYEIMDTGEASPGEKVLLLNMPVRPENDWSLKQTIESKQPGGVPMTAKQPAIASTAGDFQTSPKLTAL
ncbi:acyl-homoserine-lactone synthase [Pseudomonas sp. SWRI102]|uniref:Acyl-homoserine-lactone synthase n=1 Tax=Pseudomonas marvdashtae TaxID=2745500 RepID=A0A923FRI6_9PSED|nr:acyl-homoserine-lactone synthase [Pseudomonas marvdashtae]MBV4553773.1 acyl-homoserine-lactone synthase [Pseudomonas marvdashtae]